MKRALQTGFGASRKTCSTPKRSLTSSRRRAHAERLGRVVAGADDRDAELARERAEVLLRLAREQRVGAGRGRLERDAARPARADRRACARARARPGTRSARARRSRSRARPAPAAARPRRASRARRAGCRRARRTSRRRAAAAPRRAARCCRARWCAVERQVVGGERDAGGEQPLEPAASCGGRPTRGSPSQKSPWCTSSSCGALDGGALEHLERRGDGAARRARRARRPIDLQPDRPVVAEAVVSSSRSRKARISSRAALTRRSLGDGERAAGAAPRPRQRIGVPRFELGTSPTRTERATRLRHTPEAPIIAHSAALAGARLRGVQKRTTCTCSPPGRVSESPSTPSAPIANVVQMIADDDRETRRRAEREGRAAPGRRG